MSITFGNHNFVLDRVMDDDYVCTLSPESVVKAQKELNEDPKDRLASVKALREWLLQQPHMTAPTDTIFLLAFLRTSKFSQLRARKMLTGFITSITTHPEWFRNIDPLSPDITKVLDSKYIVPLPSPDRDGRRVFMYRAGAVKADKPQFTWDEEVRVCILHSMLLNRDEERTVHGGIIIFDCSGMTLKHISRVKMDEMRKWNKAWQKKLPGRFKGFHFYNAGTLLDAFMMIFKPFLDKKFQERIYVHNTAESLYKMFPKDILPLEYLPDDYDGPSAGSLDQILHDYKKYIHHDAFRKYISDATGSTVNIDLNKAPLDVPDASFRKLTVE